MMPRLSVQVPVEMFEYKLLDDNTALLQTSSPVFGDELLEAFAAVVEEVLDPDWSLGKLHQRAAHL